MELTLVVVCGWSLSGKSTIAGRLSEKLDVHWVDIDNIRALHFGRPDPNPTATEESRKRDGEEIKGSYNLLYRTADLYLGMSRSLIVTATFSRNRYYDEILQALVKYPHAKLKIVWCVPLHDTDAEMLSRLEKRQFGVNCWSSVNSIEYYKEIKNRYETPALPHLDLDTSSSDMIDQVVELAINYTLS